jgi:hypothetical protein
VESGQAARAGRGVRKFAFVTATVGGSSVTGGGGGGGGHGRTALGSLLFVALRSVGLFVAPLACLACVPSVPHFITHAEARVGHPAEDAEYGTVESWVSEDDLAKRPAETPATRRALPRAAYWHWNGVSYELVEPAWDDERPGYLWQWHDEQETVPR